jgi:HD superfamily phosphohydrolase
VARHPFAAVNLISDPIHGYLELTKRLARDESTALGLPDEDAAEDDLLDTAWLQRLRRISQLQSARWVFPTAEHSRFTHGLGVMHEAGLWARALLPSLRSALPAAAPGEPLPSEGLVVETLRIAGLLHDVGHGPFAHYFDDQVLSAFPAREDARRGPGKRLSHEDLSELIIERELADVIRAIRRAPGSSPERDAFADGESIDPRWLSFLVAKPALVDDSMPAWVRILQPLLSGVFTVDNLDYVRRDAFFTGVKVGIDVERLRRYAYISDRGLTLYEPGVPALEGFLNARLLLYLAVYFHRTVRAIDLDLADVFRPAIEALFGDDSPADRLADYVDLDEYALLHQAARWARGQDVLGPGERATPGEGRVTAAVADGWRAILLRRPRWRSEAEVRVTYEAGDEPDAAVEALGAAIPGLVTIDRAVVDARPVGGHRLAIETRDGRDVPVGQALERVPGFAMIARRYRRA